MSLHLIIFDLDGVLLSDSGYHPALQASVRIIGDKLGLKDVSISDNQIAQFETLGITNEWDTLAICTALMLVFVWNFNHDIRLNTTFHKNNFGNESVNFSIFLSSFKLENDLPGLEAFQWISENYPRLNHEEKSYLYEILYNCRDIYHSLTLPIHQEIVLGSDIFRKFYNLEPTVQTIGFLSNYDRKAISADNFAEFLSWLKHPNNLAGIMTNRPSQSPPGFLSAPEAELGIKTSGFDFLPYIGSGYLAWYATQKLKLPGYTLMKPNPVHALTTMRLCAGEELLIAVEHSADLWLGNQYQAVWEMFANAKVTVFEDSVKGLQSAINAVELLRKKGINMDLSLVGVSDHPVKIDALNKITKNIIKNINMADWNNC
jgi:phosphoglycolate phosphatase-like HAD superfamily hydrolase